MENDADRKGRTANESRMRIGAFDRIVGPWGRKGAQASDEPPQRLLGGEGGASKGRRQWSLAPGNTVQK